MRLIFVRHGEPDYDHDCLTENGRRQAQSTAKRLRQEPIRKIFASPMGRTVETASYTAQMHGLEIETLDFMHEIDWGGLREADGSQRPLECEGHPWTLGCKLLTEHPEFIGSPDWAEHHYFRDNICTGYMDTISEGMDAFLTRFGLYGIGPCVRAGQRQQGAPSPGAVQRYAPYRSGQDGSPAFREIKSPFRFA